MPSLPATLRRYRRLVATAVPMIVMGVQAAHADVIQDVGPGGTLTAASTWADTAAGQSPPSVNGTGTSNGTSPAVVNDLSSNMSSTYTFSRTISNPNGSYAGFTINDAGQGSENIGFLDSYVFTVPTAISNAALISLNLGTTLGLDDLSMRIYDYSSTDGYLVNVAGPVASGLLVDAWSQSSNASSGNYIASTSIAPKGLAAGTYVLEVAGLETGGVSGTYQGSLNVEPVPLPATLPLLVGGLGILTSAIRRRRSARS
jgi:hypothetical protein